MSARLLILLDAGSCMVACRRQERKRYIAWSYLLSYGGKEFLLSLQK